MVISLRDESAGSFKWSPDGNRIISAGRDANGDKLLNDDEIKLKALTAVEQKQAGAWSRGDIVRVRLDIDAQSDMTWVVVNDPIPAGATIVGVVYGYLSLQRARTLEVAAAQLNEQLTPRRA